MKNLCNSLLIITICVVTISYSKGSFGQEYQTYRTPQPKKVNLTEESLSKYGLMITGSKPTNSKCITVGLIDAKGVNGYGTLLQTQALKMGGDVLFIEDPKKVIVQTYEESAGEYTRSQTKLNVKGHVYRCGGIIEKQHFNNRRFFLESLYKKNKMDYPSLKLELDRLNQEQIKYQQNQLKLSQEKARLQKHIKNNSAQPNTNKTSSKTTTTPSKSASAASNSAIKERLEQAKKLHSDGLISQSEYDALRKKILSEI